MRITAAIISAAIAGAVLHSLIVGLIAGAVVFSVWQKKQTHRVIVEDLETGRITIQPMDDQTQRYLNSRKDI